MSIDMLPDDVLLGIFGFYVDEAPRIEAWQSLVHVCRRWRSIAFRSPRRLNLRLVCSNETPARDTLDVRPALPLFIQCYETVESMDKYNIVAVLERNDRVCDITLVDLKRWEWEKISAAMQVPFPELTHLQLWSYDEAMSVLPDSFSGRHVPRLDPTFHPRE